MLLAQTHDVLVHHLAVKVLAAAQCPPVEAAAPTEHENNEAQSDQAIDENIRGASVGEQGLPTIPVPATSIPSPLTHPEKQIKPFWIHAFKQLILASCVDALDCVFSKKTTCCVTLTE